MAWSPNQEQLAYLAALLEESVAPQTPEHARNRARLALEEAERQPELPLYLSSLLGSPQQWTITVRATAGLWLKTVLNRDWLVVRGSTEQLKPLLLPALADQNTLVRSAGAIAVATLMGKLGLAQWPDLPIKLLEMTVGGETAEAQDGAISTLANVCEDMASDLDKNAELMGTLVPQLLNLCSGDRPPRVRAKAIFCLAQFVPVGSPVFLVYIDEFMQRLFNLALDPTPDTRQQICTAFNSLLVVRPDKLLPHLEGVVNFCLHCLQDQEESLAMEAAEFLLALAHSEDVREAVPPLLGSIVPQILRTMIYSEDDQFTLETLAENDENQADRDQDIRPSMPKHRQGHGANKAGDDDDEGDEEELEDSLEGWNLRKCSAATLDQLAIDWASPVLEIALPHMLQRINDSSSWPVRESAVLAFGAIAQGCIEAGELAFVPELAAFLTKLLADEHAPLREMSCWTLSRYSENIIQDSSLITDAFQGILRCSLDHNKKVQEAGCAALSAMAETAGDRLVPWTEPLLQHLQQCFAKYQLRNMFSLYECVQTVCAAVQPRLHDHAVLAYIMDPLVARWQLVGNDDFEFLALLECMSAVAVAAGPAFSQYAPTVFERCYMVIRDTLVDIERYVLDPQSMEDVPESGKITCALDLIDGLVQALPPPEFSALLAACQSPTFVEVLVACLGDQVDMSDVWQSALALVGDMAIFAVDELAPTLSTTIPMILGHITSGEDIGRGGYLEAVCSNAMWSLGEIAYHTPQGSMEPYFNDGFQRLGTNLVTGPPKSATVLENAANALGRLGLNVPGLLAPHLEMFIEQWLKVMLDQEETMEKDTSVQGMCLALAANPAALSGENQLMVLLKLFAQLFTPSEELKALVSKVLGGYKQYLNNFDEVVSRLPLEYRQQLSHMYSI